MTPAFAEVEARSAVVNPTHPRDPVLAEWFGGATTQAGATVTPETALSCPAVYSSLGLLADTIGTIPLNLYERGKGSAREKKVKHPLHKLLHDAPNSWQTSVQWRQEQMFHLGTFGNGYSRIRYRGDGMPVALEPFYPRDVTPFKLDKGGVAYRVGPTGETLLSHEVLHLRRRPFDRHGISGKSPVTLHRETIGRAMGQAAYMASFFGNSAAPKGVLELEQPVTDKAATSLRESWERRHQGTANAHRLAILDGGMKFKPIGMSNQDAQTLEAYQSTVSEIASRVYGVPSHLIGLNEKQTSFGTGVEQQSIGFVVYSIRPYAVDFEQVLNQALIPPSRRGSLFFEFNVEGLLRGDAKASAEVLATHIQWGIMTPNEARKLKNLPPLEGGDSRLQPLNMAPAEKITEILLKDTAKAQRAVEETTK
ncbi:MAG: phage portal protein [Magnetococcales bacterium]|nr:phage portal protein [Magnetococcales bacterium]